jgi:CRISPR-associated protein Csd1
MMILQALYEHYQRLLDDPDINIAAPGYSTKDVTHALILDKGGNLVDIMPLNQTKGKKLVPIEMMVPEQGKHQNGINPFYLSDDASYMLGLCRDKGKNITTSGKKFEAFRDANLKLIADCRSDSAISARRFLQSWQPKSAFEHQIVLKYLDELVDGKNLVIRLDGADHFLHEEAEVRWAWESFKSSQSSSSWGQCLITGEKGPIARLHTAFTGFPGAQSSGTYLVSFNNGAFESYGKEQSYNSPVSEYAAYAYGTVLKYFLAGNTNKIRLADIIVVFWADKPGSHMEEEVFNWSLDPKTFSNEQDDNDNRIADQATENQARTVLKNLRAGLPVGLSDFDSDTRCFILGLAPNAARLAVSFWRISSFGEALQHIAQHYNDMDIVGLDKYGTYISPYRILKSAAVKGDIKNIPPLLAGQLLKSILTGSYYPQTLIHAIMKRCRSGGDHGGLTAIRAGVIKAYLLRWYRLNKKYDKEALITMALNEQNTNIGYLFGRLFAVLEKAQKDALGTEINATIRDRYFSSASSTPRAVFPLLLRLSRHHTAKAQYGGYLESLIQDILSKIDSFPTHLSFDQQGQFILGYYHQNQSLYTKNDSNSKEEK